MNGGHESIDELDPDLTALLREEAARPSPDDAIKAAVRNGLAAIVAPPSPSPSPPRRPSVLGPGAATAAKVGAALLVGGVLGAGVHAKIAAPAVVYRDRVVTVPPSSSPPPVPILTTSAPPSPATGAPSQPTTKPAPARRPGLDLGAEQRILDIARTALGRGEGAAALAALDRHAREFPGGQLAEEREALAVRALVLSGRRSEAADRAARFRTRFPDSPLTPKVDEALR